MNTVELLKHYPSGIVLGSSEAIVGDLGLTVNWVNPDGSNGQKKYNGDEKISIIEVKGEWLILAEPFPDTKIHAGLFKGFTIKKH